MTANLEELECETLAQFYCVSSLARAAEAAAALFEHRNSNLIVFSALFTEACVFYAVALDKFQLGKHTRNASFKKAEGYDKVIHKTLMTFRNQVVAHRDSTLHTHQFMEAVLMGAPPEGPPKKLHTSMIFSTTTIGPMNDELLGAIASHIHACRDYMAHKAEATLGRYAAAVREVGSTTMKAPPLGARVRLEPSLSPDKKRAALDLPEELAMTQPPVGSDNDTFLELTYRLTARDYEFDQPILETFFNIRTPKKTA